MVSRHRAGWDALKHTHVCSSSIFLVRWSRRACISSAIFFSASALCSGARDAGGCGQARVLGHSEAVKPGGGGGQDLYGSIFVSIFGSVIRLSDRVPDVSEVYVSEV